MLPSSALFTVVSIPLLPSLSICQTTNIQSFPLSEEALSTYILINDCKLGGISRPKNFKEFASTLSFPFIATFRLSVADTILEHDSRGVNYAPRGVSYTPIGVIYGAASLVRNAFSPK
jgi:hypothetical protein